MKGKNNAGFSLVEILVAIAILAGIVIPACTSLVVSLRVNAKAEAVLQARIAVSSAVETLMAEGITEASVDYRPDDFPDVKIVTSGSEAEPLFYKVTVTSEPELVSVTTYIRAAEGEGAE